MKILNLVVLFLLAGHAMAADAIEYNLSGTVTKKGGGPLDGVKVLLKGKNVSVITGADGKFALPPPIAVRMNAPQNRTLSFTLRGDAVAFSHSAGLLNGKVAIFSGNGRCIASTDFSGLNPATDRITLPQLASGFNIVRVSVNDAVYTCQVIRSGSGLHLISKHAATSSDGDFTLAKNAASSAVDTLVATKAGFKDAETPVGAYTLSGVAIVMDSIVGDDTGAIAWGKVENPTTRCKVGTLPEYSALTANSKLPDPFMKLDKTRIKNKSEWPCRREEIVQQMYKYILGEKPIPAKGSVTGTVSTSKITVTVSESGKSCSFSAAVNMNGATAPAPAIIIYEGGFGSSLPIPSGVAKITFTAEEKSGGTGAKSGQFYKFYGTDHPAGYMVAQAWQVSRIIDVLEQNPGTIDAFRIGVTGCSRNGKGAFFGGVLDNRIALTIPCESGIGGTVALRLVEKLDTGGEWPYHAISYVRWLSEVALGKFTNANNASGDNTDKLPVDMHSAMALIAPRGLYIVDNASGTYAGLDKSSAYVTGMVGKEIFKALGVGDNFSYECASGTHCDWRSQYNASLNTMIDKFLKGNASAKTGTVNSDLGSKPNAKQYYDWDATELPGEL